MTIQVGEFPNLGSCMVGAGKFFPLIRGCVSLLLECQLFFWYDFPPFGRFKSHFSWFKENKSSVFFQFKIHCGQRRPFFANSHAVGIPKATTPSRSPKGERTRRVSFAKAKGLMCHEFTFGSFKNIGRSHGKK